MGNRGKCQKCHRQVNGNYCMNCGKKINLRKLEQGQKDPWDAALWNLAIFGAGFIYLGEWGKAIAAMLIFFLVGILTSALFGIWSGVHIIVIIAAYLVVVAACFEEAKRMNEGIS